MEMGKNMLKNVASLREAFIRSDRTRKDLQKTNILLKFYMAEIEIEKIMVLNEIRMEIERVGDMLENKE